MATPTACGHSWARDWIHAAAVIWTTEGDSAGSLTHSATREFQKWVFKFLSMLAKFTFFITEFFFFIFNFFFLLFRATPAPVVYVNSQARDWIGATATGLHHSHSNVSDPSFVCNLHHSSQKCQILHPLSETRDRSHILMDTSWIHFHWAMMGTPSFFFFFFFFNGCTCGIGKFPGQVSNPSHSCGNTGSFKPLCKARDRIHTSAASKPLQSDS